MSYDYGCGCGDNSASEYFSWMDDAAVEDSFRDHFKTHHFISGVQPEYYKSLSGLVVEETSIGSEQVIWGSDHDRRHILKLGKRFSSFLELPGYCAETVFHRASKNIFDFESFAGIVFPAIRWNISQANRTSQNLGQVKWFQV